MDKGIQNIFQNNELSSENTLLLLLKERIAYLIDHDFSGLMTHFYLVDVDENQVQYFLQTYTGDLLLEKLARLIIDRTLKKKSNWD
mgnify:CR=1 FL=1